MNTIQQVTDPMPTNLSYIDLAKLLLMLLMLHLLQNYCYHCYRYCCSYHYYQNYHTTLLLITLLQIIISRCGWTDNSTANTCKYSLAPLLCRIYKFGLNTLPSKTFVTPYTCGLWRPFYGAVAWEHSYICWFTWDYYLFITMKNLKDTKTKTVPLRRGEVRISI